MKKQLVSGLCLALSTLMCVGCGSGAGSKSAGAGGASSSGDAPLDLNVMIWDRGDSVSGTTVDNNATTAFIKQAVLKDCNVNVNFVPVPRSGSNDKINVMMAGGNAPDIIFSYDRNLFGDFATKGGLTDLTSYLDQFGSQIKTTLGDDILSVGVIDGKQFAIPAKRSPQKVQHVGFIRKDWVEALGKELPTNKQELMDLLYEFKEKDPGKVGDKLVPWAMGGTQDSEKYYLDFVSSYVDLTNPKDQYEYYGFSKVLNPQAKEGLKVMNKLYNDGIIKKDFAVDTNDDIYKQDIINGNAGFFMEDNFRPIDEGWIESLLQNDPKANFVPINILESPNGEVTTAAEAAYGMYIMVPKASEAKAEAAMKYLNWQANVENSMKVRFTENYTADANGIPNKIEKSELEAKKYATTRNDYTILTQYWDYYKNKDGVVGEWTATYPYLGKDYFSFLYDQETSHLYNEPVIQEILATETKYLSNLQKLGIELAYTSISAPTANFEAAYTAALEKAQQAGLQEVLDERATYYDTKVAK